jgi:hypothetical protein
MFHDASVDLLYWSAQENDLAYAVSEEAVKEPHFDSDLGFRLGFCYELPHDRWQIRLSFTHLHTKARHSAEGELFPLWAKSNLLEGSFVDEAEMRWRLHLGLVDLECAKELKVSRCLRISPYVGVRSAWIRQKDKIVYKGGDLFAGGEDEVSMKNKFWGMGPRLGGSTEWILGGCFSLVGNAALSLLYGEFYVHQDEDATVGVLQRVKEHDIFHQSSLVTDLALGLQWKREGTILRGGYEQHIFFGQNQLLHFEGNTIVSSGEPLSLQGWTLSATWEF